MIAIVGMTATGQIAISLLPPTGTPGDTIFRQTAGSGSVTVSVDTAPGTGNAFNGRYTVLRYS